MIKESEGGCCTGTGGCWGILGRREKCGHEKEFLFPSAAHGASPQLPCYPHVIIRKRALDQKIYFFLNREE